MKDLYLSVHEREKSTSVTDFSFCNERKTIWNLNQQRTVILKEQSSIYLLLIYVQHLLYSLVIQMSDPFKKCDVLSCHVKSWLRYKHSQNQVMYCLTTVGTFHITLYSVRLLMI